MNYLQQYPLQGTYLQLGAKPVDVIARFRSRCESEADGLLKRVWLSPDEIKAAAIYPTTLRRFRRMTEFDFDLIVRHGYETAMWNHLLLAQGGSDPQTARLLEDEIPGEAHRAWQALHKYGNMGI